MIIHNSRDCGTEVRASKCPSLQLIYCRPASLDTLALLVENLSMVQYGVRVLRSGESPSVSEQGGPVCASPGRSSSPFVIIKFSESRFCLSDTSRGSCEKTIFPREDVWGGKAAETNVFHQGKDSLERLFKTILFASGFHYHIWDGGHRQGREHHKINLF